MLHALIEKWKKMKLESIAETESIDDVPAGPGGANERTVILGAQGAYRAPSDSGFIFMVILDVKLAKSTKE